MNNIEYLYIKVSHKRVKLTNTEKTKQNTHETLDITLGKYNNTKKHTDNFNSRIETDIMKMQILNRLAQKHIIIVLRLIIIN